MKMLQYWLAGMLGIFARQSYTQTNNSLLPKTISAGPNTTQFQKFTTFEVAYHTGVPDISIPVKTIKSGDLEMPLSFSYHAGGNKLNEVPGWVGMGWDFKCTYKITRAIVGNRADETSTGYLRQFLPPSLNSAVDSQLLLIDDIAKGTFDAEPDIFSYEVPGQSGRFFFDRSNNMQPATIPFAPVRINKYFDPLTNKLWFSIVNAEGVTCIFGDNYREVSSGSNGGVSFENTTAWILEKMISPDKRDTIYFNYTMQSSIAQEDIAETWVIDDNVDNKGVIMTPGEPSRNPYSANPQKSFTSSGHSSVTTEYLLSEVLFKNGKMVISPSSAGRRDFRPGGTHSAKSLSSIKFYNRNPGTGAYQLQESYQLYQSYFMKGNDSSSRRLRLDSVQVRDKNEQRVYSYKMQYDPQMLPARNEKSKDLWGYFNGRSNSSLIPQMLLNYQPGVGGSGSQITVGSDNPVGREVDSVKAQASVLKRLYLPTGGYNDYEYESNRYLENGAMKLAGGLRIKSIKAYDPIGNTRLTRFYKYGKNENGAGTKNFQLNNSYFIAYRNHRYFQPTSFDFPVIATKTSRTITANPSTDIVGWDGAIVVYTEVTEYIDSLGASGKTVVVFDDIADPLVAASYAKPVKTSYFFKRGKPLSKTIYKRVGNSYVLKEAEQLYYQAFDEKIYQNAGIVATKTVTNEGAIDDGGPILQGSLLLNHDVNSYRVAYYSILSGDNLLTSKVNLSYDDGDANRYYRTVEAYEYNNQKHMQVTRTYQISSEGDTLFQTKKYAADYLSGSSTGNAALDSMLSRNMQTEVIETAAYRVDKGTTLKKYTGADLTTYKLVNGNKDIVKNAEKRLAIDRPVTNFTASAIAGGNLISDSRYQDQTVYNNYSTTGALTQYTEKKAGPTAQLWDHADDEIVAIAVNANLSEMAYTSFETGSKGNFSYTGATTADASAPTGERAYHLGQTSGNITFPALSASQVYRISYWTKNSNPYTLNGTQSGYPLKGQSFGQWTYYEHKVTGIASLTLSGTGWIDELRLCPFGSRMGIRSVVPGIGVTATADDAGNLMRYEYDLFNRFKLVREFNNILKTIEYQYKK
ncbi:hypothetical protein [Chitinophaga rhizophila]|uniref:YD repeat-containing protein n=1 Tax=Chitinophaga rhizophila TaxID=2866212 RepID=A0ABS7GHT9_9BACT|nr:hypothetical protein [Chitinophaga rhizophila]MBW8687266.1 hypothetical protein [Chitinophaga rhizophila]